MLQLVWNQGCRLGWNGRSRIASNAVTAPRSSFAADHSHVVRVLLRRFAMQSVREQGTEGNLSEGVSVDKAQLRVQAVPFVACFSCLSPSHCCSQRLMRVTAATFLTILCFFTTLNCLLRQVSARSLNPIHQAVRRHCYVQSFERYNSMQAIIKRQTGHPNDRVKQMRSMFAWNQGCVRWCGVAQSPWRWECGA